MRSRVGATGGNSHVCHPCPRNPRRLSAASSIRSVCALRSEKDYQKAVAILDEIIDEIGQDEAHPLADLAEALGLFIHSYEETHAKIPKGKGFGSLRSLMEAHGLTQSELPETRKPGACIQNPLRRTSELNIRQSRRLAKNDSESPSSAVFTRTTAGKSMKR